MRAVEDIRADYDEARGATPNLKRRIIAAEQRLVKDIPDLLEEIARVRKVIERQKAHINGLEYDVKSLKDQVGVVESEEAVGIEQAAKAEKDAEIERLRNVVEYRRVAHNIQNEDIKELRAKIKELRDEID